MRGQGNLLAALDFLAADEGGGVGRSGEHECIELSSMDAGNASRQVGYLSASQFSREYGRFFGSAPAADITRLREVVTGAEIE